MKNYGKVECKVEVGNTLPYHSLENNWIAVSPMANAWQASILKNQYFKPVLCEHFKDTNGVFDVIYPEKMKYYINNAVKGVAIPSDSSSASGSGSSGSTDSATKPYIHWTPLTIDPNDTSLGRIKDTCTKYPYKDVFTEAASGSVIQEEAAIWQNRFYEAQGATDDFSVVYGVDSTLSFLKEIDAFKSIPADPEDYLYATINDPNPKLGYIYQQTAKDGLIYGAESDVFLTENMPFWINIHRPIASPTTYNHETQIIISLGIADSNGSGSANGGSCQEYDLILKNNAKPELIDYWYGRAGDNQQTLVTSPGVSDSSSNLKIPKVNRTTFEVDLSKILREQEFIDVGFMTVAGRLCIFVNGVLLLYNRINPTNSELLECKISASKIRVYGTNSQMAINASAMTYAPLAAFAVMLPSLTKSDGTSMKDKDGNNSVYRAVSIRGELITKEGALCKFPTPKNNSFPQIYGVNCMTYEDWNGTIPMDDLSSFGFHTYAGYMWFAKSGSAQPKDGVSLGDYYILAMKPSEMPTNIKDPSNFNGYNTLQIRNGGCPYFFGLNGAADVTDKPAEQWVDISKDIINIGQQDTLDQRYCMLNKKLNLTLYNKGGTYDYLRNKQQAFRVTWKWCQDGNNRMTFTGINTNSSIEETPGKEVINISCEDSMYILRKTQIINSPSFDGMWHFAAIKVLLKMAGFVDPDIVWGDPESRDWLPAGQSVDNFAVRFDRSAFLYDCVTSIAKRNESQVFFDGEGKPHVFKIDGGLFFDNGNENPVVKFTTMPSTNEDTETLIDNKTIEYSIDSTFNDINVLTTNKRNGFIVQAAVSAKEASAKYGNPVDTLMFRKTYWERETAWGSQEEALKACYYKAEKMFWPILKVSFKCVGLDGKYDIKPLSIISVDDLIFRIVSINRTYSADSNDYIMEISADWAFGRQAGVKK